MELVKQSSVPISKWRIEPNDYSIQDLLTVLRQVIYRKAKLLECPVLLLSGGVDSTILLMLLLECVSDVTCITIGESLNHPDMVAAKRLAEEMNFNWVAYIPSLQMKNRAQNRIEKPYFPGDEGVLLALECASGFGTSIWVTDGIDEQMGGYWWHANTEDIYNTFKNFWDELESKHLSPMYRSAQIVGVDICWPFLDPLVIDYIARIPLEDRVANGECKVVWKEIARELKVPDWIIKRPKLGFVDALSLKKD